MRFKPLLQFLVMGPLLVVTVILLVMLVAANLDGMLGFSRFNYSYINSVLASFLLCSGLVLTAVSGLLLIRSGGGLPYGDVVKSRQTRLLVTSGPYRFSRNPMILGYLITISSVGVFLGSVSGALAIPAVALLLLSGWVKLVEEEGLEKRFGDEYRNYRKRVPFLLPSLRMRRREQ